MMLIQTDFGPNETYRITKLAFRNRFTILEKIAIESATLSPVVRVVLKDLEAATFIDLSRRELREGLELLVGEGLLTQERVDEILSAKITTVEKYLE